MRYQRLGEHGALASAVGLGCYTFGRYLDLPKTRSVGSAVLDGGVTLLDTADAAGEAIAALAPRATFGGRGFYYFTAYIDEYRSSQLSKIAQQEVSGRVADVALSVLLRR